jgi:redox-sensitive bicupin YhaK (pirin superfamily)
MSVSVRRAGERYRGGDPAAGVRTLHAFSFAGFYDPDNTRFGLLLACNEEQLAPGAGFAEHPHRDTEIVSLVLEGELEHRGEDGRATRLRAGGAQLLGAGGGVRHVERNPGREPLRFLQMWLHPDAFGGPPRYAAAPAALPPGPGLHPLASGDPDSTAPLRLRQAAATLHIGRGAAALPEAPFLYLHVIRGTLRVGPDTLAPGDALRAGHAPALHAQPATEDAEYAVWEMHAEPSYG